MKILKLEYHIMAPREKVWLALVDPAVIEKWGGGPATMNDQAGTEFKLWGGDIWGKNIEVVTNEKLVQDWYGGAWAQPSKLTIVLTHKEGCTGVHLFQENIPPKEFEAIKDGWTRFYFGEIKKYLETN